MVTYLDNPHTDFNCGTYSTTQSYGNKGITIWGPKTIDIHLTPGQTSGSLYFTCTKPKCWSYPSFCNVTYTIHTTTTSTNAYVGPITMTLYKNENEKISSNRYHSKIGGHDLTETHDISQGDYAGIYNDTGQNYIRFTNNDSQVDVWIQGLQIVRGYDMLNLSSDMQTPCPCSADNTASGDSDFATRQDYPCNYEKCGGLSFTGYNHDDHYYTGGAGTILNPNTTYTWYWTNPTATFNNHPNNYSSFSHCLFNFNNVCLCNNNGTYPDPNLQASTDDVPFYLKINNSDWATFYHCKRNSDTSGNDIHMAHSVDLATHSYLHNYYHDNPGDNNTLSLYIPNNPNPGVNLFLVDGGVGYVNLYRIYETASLCQTITVSQSTGGTISPGTTTVSYGANQSFTITANQGYSIANVYVNGGDTGAWNSPYVYTFYDVTGPRTLSANFGSGHTITASAGAGGSISPPGITYVAYNGSQTYTITANTGYNILNVYIDGVCYGPISSYSFGYVTANHTISATFCQQLVLAVYGIDWYPAPYNFGLPVYPNVWVDGNHVGYAPIGVCVSSGYHTVTVDNATYDPWWGITAHFSFIGDSNGNYYGNNASILVNSNTNAVAMYHP